MEWITVTIIVSYHLDANPIRTLIVGISEHHQLNVNLQKGDPTAVCRSHSPMIKSAQDGEEEVESSHNWNCSSCFFPIS